MLMIGCPYLVTALVDQRDTDLEFPFDMMGRTCRLIGFMAFLIIAILHNVTQKAIANFPSQSYRLSQMN